MGPSSVMKITEISRVELYCDVFGRMQSLLGNRKLNTSLVRDNAIVYSPWATDIIRKDMDNFMTKHQERNYVALSPLVNYND
jgi:hypothetical protein